jgi:hypothetical protein
MSCDSAKAGERCLPFIGSSLVTIFLLSMSTSTLFVLDLRNFRFSLCNLILDTPYALTSLCTALYCYHCISVSLWKFFYGIVGQFICTIDVGIQALTMESERINHDLVSTLDCSLVYSTFNLDGQCSMEGINLCN